MHLFKPPSYTYSINNTLEWVDTFKYLGAIINNKLKRGNHITEVTARVSCILNLMRTMRDYHRDAKTKIYSALVRPILEYSAPVWTPHEQQHINVLEKVQKRAARWVIGARWDRQLNCWSSPYSDSYHNLWWLTLQQHHLLLCQCQTFKIVHGIDCINFSAFKRRSFRSHLYFLSIPKPRINAFRFCECFFWLEWITTTYSRIIIPVHL